MRSVWLRHVVVSDHCNLGRRKWKGIFFKQLCLLLHTGQLDVLLLRTTENYVVSNNQKSVCLEPKTVKFLMCYFYPAVRPDLLQNLKWLLISFDNLVATDYFRFVLFCCEFFHPSLVRNVLKDSTESNSLHLEVHSGNNLLLSGSCHLPMQINSQVLLRNSTNFFRALFYPLVYEFQWHKSVCYFVLQNSLPSICTFLYFPGD